MASVSAIRELFDSGAEPDTQAMIATLLQFGGARSAPGRKADIAEQLRTLAPPFKGRPLLLFYQVGLIVHIRRQIDADLNWMKFDRVWRDHTEFLVQNLNSRWLTSVCDTIVDYSEDPAERAAALAGTLAASLIKLYETERHATGQTAASYQQSKPPRLHDGVFGFDIGKGDMVKNTLQRAYLPAPPNAVAFRILQVLLQRARDSDTVLKRFAAVHKNDATRW